MMQHDVDIINDHQLAVFDNNAAKTVHGDFVLSVNDTIIYDFDANDVSRPFAAAYEKQDIRTITEGRSEILPDGELFVEEQNYGRVLKMNEQGDLAWRYVNRDSDGGVHLVRWSRMVDRTLARRVASVYKKNRCDEAPKRRAIAAK